MVRGLVGEKEGWVWEKASDGRRKKESVSKITMIVGKENLQNEERKKN